MSSSPIPVAANNAASINAIKWNDPVQSFVPTCLKPANWCGRQWQKITNLDGKNACSKMCQVILRVVPAIFLSLATVFAFVIGFMGSCVSAKPLEYTVVNLDEALEEEMVKLTGGLAKNITEAKVLEVLNTLEIPENFMQELNKEVPEGELLMTAEQCRSMWIDMALPAVKNGLAGMKKAHDTMVTALAEKKLLVELKEKQKQMEAELAAQKANAGKPVAKVATDAKPKTKETTDAKEEKKIEVPSKDKAKADVKVQAPVVVFGQPKVSISLEKAAGMFEVASQVKATNPFQRVANAFTQGNGAAPTVSDVAKVAFLDGLRKVQADALMKQIPAEVIKKETSKMGSVEVALITKLLPEFICQKVLPALMEAIEPAVLDSSSRAKVALWAQSVTSVKLNVQLSKAQEPMFKVIVA